MSKLTENIRNFRLLRGYTQASLGILLNKAPNTVANWEKGVSSPDVDTLEEMCNILMVTPNEMLGWSESKELNTFLKEQKDNISKMDELIQQRSELDARIKEYSEKIGRRLT